MKPSAAVSLLLLKGLLNSTRWCLGALLRQMIDVSLALQAEIWGAKEIKATLGTQKLLLGVFSATYTEAGPGSPCPFPVQGHQVPLKQAC